jgi:glycosyltransferase involved in cell wall biosynthesis
MITGSYPPQPCGVGNYTQKLVEELLKAGEEVDVVTTATKPLRNEPEVTLELPDWRFGTWRRALAKIPPDRYDIAHIQYPARFYGYRPDLAFLAFNLKRALPRTPVVVTLHEFSITHPFRKLTVGAIASASAGVTLTTDSERGPLLRWYPWLRNRVRVIHMAPSIPLEPISTARRQEIRSVLGVGPNVQIVVYFGLLHPNKGVRKLIQALSSNTLIDRNLKLLFLSYFDPQKNPFHSELRDLSRAQGIAEKVIWAGFLDDTVSAEYIAASDIACLPFEDGVTLRRLSFMAAMGLGKPTITTEGDVSPAQMGLLPGEHALVLPSSCSALRLGESIGALLDSSDLRERLARGAAAWASRFRWETVVEETVALYNELRESRDP